MSALRAYIGDIPLEWDVCTSAITYAYNFQHDTSTAFATFYIVMSKPRGPIALQAQTYEPSTARDLKVKWKEWLDKSLKEASKHRSSAQERQELNYDKRFQKNDETIKLGE